nr:hypothetical protein [Oerskovia douganii]
MPRRFRKTVDDQFVDARFAHQKHRDVPGDDYPGGIPDLADALSPLISPGAAPEAALRRGEAARGATVAQRIADRHARFPELRDLHLRTGGSAPTVTSGPDFSLNDHDDEARVGVGRRGIGAVDDQGPPVRFGEHRPAAGSQHPVDLGEDLGGVGDVLEHPVGVYAVDAPVPEGQVVDVGLLHPHLFQLARQCTGLREGVGVVVEPEDGAGRADGSGVRRQVGAWPAAEVEHVEPGVEVELARRERLVAPAQVGGCEAHQVVVGRGELEESRHPSILDAGRRARVRPVGSAGEDRVKAGRWGGRGRRRALAVRT